MNRWSNLFNLNKSIPSMIKNFQNVLQFEAMFEVVELFISIHFDVPMSFVESLNSLPGKIVCFVMACLVVFSFRAKLCKRICQFKYSLWNENAMPVQQNRIYLIEILIKFSKRKSKYFLIVQSSFSFSPWRNHISCVSKQITS